MTMMGAGSDQPFPLFVNDLQYLLDSCFLGARTHTYTQGHTSFGISYSFHAITLDLERD